MSDQYSNEYYCSTCQATNEYPNKISVSVLACASNGQILTEELYNQMRSSLKSIQDFGDKDDLEDKDKTRKPRVQNLSNKNTDTLIYPDYYNSIANKIFSSDDYTEQKTGATIYGSYFTTLKNAVLNYEVPKTRYHVKKTSCSDGGGDGGTGCGDCMGACMSYQCTGCEGCLDSGGCQGYCGNGNGC